MRRKRATCNLYSCQDNLHALSVSTAVYEPFCSECYMRNLFENIFEDETYYVTTIYEDPDKNFYDKLQKELIIAEYEYENCIEDDSDYEDLFEDVAIFYDIMLNSFMESVQTICPFCLRSLIILYTANLASSTDNTGLYCLNSLYSSLSSPYLLTTLE